MEITRAINSYLINLRMSRTVGPNTERLYTHYLKRFLEFRRSRHITRLNIPPDEVNQFLDWYNRESINARGRPLSPAAYDKIYDTLRVFCRWASDLGHMRKNPFRFLKPPKVPKTIRTIAPKSAVNRFLAFVERLFCLS